MNYSPLFEAYIGSGLYKSLMELPMTKLRSSIKLPDTTHVRHNAKRASKILHLLATADFDMTSTVDIANLRPTIASVVEIKREVIIKE